MPLIEEDGSVKVDGIFMDNSADVDVVSYTHVRRHVWKG